MPADYFGLKNKMFNLRKIKVGTKNQETREKWLKKTLKKIPSGKKILDAGAGELQYKKFCSHLKYTSQDFGQYDGGGDKKGLQTKKWDNSKLDIVSDITKIPVKNNSFDAIMCIEVFEHIPEPVKAIKEFARILKSGGKLIITASFCYLTHFAPYYFANGYSKYWYQQVLKEYNFKINEIKYNGNFFESLAQEIRRIPYIEKRYTKLYLSKRLLSKLSFFLIFNLLNKLSKNNKKSEEMLCFGLHILAVKK